MARNGLLNCQQTGQAPEKDFNLLKKEDKNMLEDNNYIRGQSY